jgi:hypothetical protein
MTVTCLHKKSDRPDFEDAVAASQSRSEAATISHSERSTSVEGPIVLGSLAADFVTGYAEGLEYRATALSDLLRAGSSYPGGTVLSDAGAAARSWEPLSDAGPVLGGVIVFGSDIANGEGIEQSGLNAIGTSVGGYAGAIVGGAACGVLTGATDGVGSFACGALTGLGSVAGGIVGGWVGDEASKVASWF